MEIVVIIALCLTVSLIFSEIFARMNYPRVIGQIVAGIVLGMPLIRDLITDSAIENIAFLSELGIIFLLLLAGLEINIKKFKKSSKTSIYIALFTSVTSFIFGYFLVKVMLNFGIISLSGYNSEIIAAIVGACFALTAEGTTLNVLIETNTLNTKLGTIMLGAGIMDDFFEVLFLGLLLIYINGSFLSIGEFPVFVMSFVILTYLIIRTLPKLIRFIQKEHSRIATLSTFIVIALVISAISQMMGIGPIIGAFIAGLIIQWANRNKKDEQEDVKELSIMSFSLIVPFFFINIGLHSDFHIIFEQPLLVLLVVIVGTAGKLFGSMLTVPFTDLNLNQATLVGWGMNARGAMELVIVEIARINNLISTELYSAIIFMAVVTTLFFPFILKRSLINNPNIMDPEKEDSNKEKLEIHERRKNVFLRDVKHHKDN